MTDLDVVLAVRDRIVREWIRFPGVVGIGIGGKLVNGRTTGELALVVSVVRKPRLDEIPPGERIPSEIDGVKTDIVVRRLPSLQQSGAVLIDNETVRPIVGGTRLEGMTFQLKGIDFDLGFGSAGFLARTTDDNQIVIVTNHHVLHDLDVEGDGKNFLDPDLPATLPDPNASRPAKKKIGRRVGQPDLNNVSLCLPCCRHIMGNVYDSILSYQIDGAIVGLATSVIPPALDYRAAVHRVGAVTGERDLLLPAEQPAIANASIVVQKRGIRTTYTRGYVTKVDESLERIDRGAQPFEHVMEVVPCPPFLSFSLAGDSGSAVTDLTGKLAGMLFAGTGTSDDAIAHTNVCHIRYLKKHLKIELLTDTGPQSVPPTNHSTVSPRPGDREEGVSALGAAGVDVDDVSALGAEKVRALLGTSTGKSVWQAIERNQSEAAALVRENVRVAAAWRRYRGAAAARELLACLSDSGRTVTPALGRFSWEESVDRVLETLHRYGSPELKADILHCRPLLRGLSGKSVDNLLAELGT